jgi:hypothetical protein
MHRDVLGPQRRPPDRDQTDRDTPVYVEGTEVRDTVGDPVCTSEAGVDRCRGTSVECVSAMSDPRVTGTYPITSNADCLGGAGCLFWGNHVIEGPEGSWDCEWTGSRTVSWMTESWRTCSGSVSAVAHTRDSPFAWNHVIGPDAAFGDGKSFHGMVYADGLPAMTAASVAD